MTQTERCNSEKVQELHRKICQLKANKQMEAKFMQAWEEKVLERQEAYEEGKQVGEERGTDRERQEVAKLCGRLMERAITDMTYRKKLLSELEL